MGTAMTQRKLLLACVPLLLAACASVPSAQQIAARTARYAAAAGKPVSSIQLVDRNFYSWNAVNDHQLAVYVTPARAFLLDLPPCPGLVTANAIGYTARMDQVSTNFDRVITDQGGVPCPIRQIRPLNVKLLRSLRTTSTHGQIHAEPRAHRAGSGRGGRP